MLGLFYFWPMPRMLKLKLSTDPRWVDIASKNISEILTDHAFCEQKAASSAISLIIQYPEYSELVDTMTDLAQEELSHFQEVHQLIKSRGLILGRERKDPYVNDLRQFFVPAAKDRTVRLVHQLLLAAMIEARSCERFRVLSENIGDPELAAFYHRLMKSEAGHYSTFLLLAKKYAPADVDVDGTWNALLQFEGAIMAKYGRGEGIHG